MRKTLTGECENGFYLLIYSISLRTLSLSALNLFQKQNISLSNIYLIIKKLDIFK